MKNVIAMISIIFIIILIIGCKQTGKITGPQQRPIPLFFKLDKDYTGNYLGKISCDDRNACRSVESFELFDYCFDQIIPHWSCTADVTTGKEDCYCDLPTNENKENCKPDIVERCTEGLKLHNGYFVIETPYSESMIKNFAIFDKSIITKTIYEDVRLPSVPEDFPNGIQPGMGESMEMPKDELYKYVISEHPLKEAYFCIPKPPEEVPCPKPGPNAEVETWPKQCFKPILVDWDKIALDLSQGRIPEECKKIEI